MATKLVIQVAGPTAVGKTAMAIELATWLNTEIISFDSRQCYKELNIGVARPSSNELATIPHHFIASHSIHEPVDAAVFATYATQKLNQLFEKHSVVVMVGGTGLYWKAFYEGLDAIPTIDPGLRQQIVSEYEEKGLAWLQQQLVQKDPQFVLLGEMKNPQRMMRALEVVLTTGESIFSFRKKSISNPDFQLISIGLELPRAILIERIHARVLQMMEQGLFDEVKQLQSYSTLNALQTVGYQELFAHLAGVLSMEQAIEQIQINTRQYAKRQMTWFKRQAELNWFAPDQFEVIQQFVGEKLN